MEEKALEVLNILYDNGYEGYIVGGYVRDKLLGIESNDIDICTSATPRDLVSLFDCNTSKYNYGSIGVLYKGSLFDVTTYRKEIKYDDYRNPIKLKYVKKIKTDLLRRDFTINSLCIDKNGKVVDFINIKSDLDNKQVKVIGNPRYKLKEDPLRIMRAIRFACILDFDIESRTMFYIKKYGHLLKRLSYSRKKQELDKIFMSKNSNKGIKLIIDLGLDEYLDIKNLRNILVCNDIIGIWSQLDVADIYPFTKLEKDQMKSINEMLSKDYMDKYNIYKYGLYISCVVWQIKELDIQKLNEIYKDISIKSSDEIEVKSLEIAKCLNREPGSYLKDIFNDVEKNIVNGYLKNDKDVIIKYIVDKYSK